jgi:hypothetical protein
VLYFDVEVDRSAFGFRSTNWLWMPVPLSRLAATGEALARFPAIAYAAIAYAAVTSGPANLAAFVICRDEPECYDFLTAKAGSLPLSRTWRRPRSSAP